jgi:hypothetical protein
MSGSSWRTEPLPPGWGATCDAILARDPVCRWGTVPGIEPREDGLCIADSSEVDHIGQAWDHRPEVLRGICHVHHVARSTAQGRAAKKAKRDRRLRPTPDHPGYAKEVP